MVARVLQEVDCKVLSGTDMVSFSSCWRSNFA